MQLQAAAWKLYWLQLEHASFFNMSSASSVIRISARIIASTAWWLMVMITLEKRYETWESSLEWEGREAVCAQWVTQYKYVMIIISSCNPSTKLAENLWRCGVVHDLYQECHQSAPAKELLRVAKKTVRSCNLCVSDMMMIRGTATDRAVDQRRLPTCLPWWW